jgi:hypothetical protein
MLGSFLDKLGGFFDRRFILAYVTPSLILLLLLIGILQSWFGLQPTLSWWTHIDGQEKILLGVGVLLTVVLLASTFEMITAPIVRLYEGYWKEGKLTDLAIAYHQKRKSKYARIKRREELNAEYDALITEREITVDEARKALIDEKLEQIYTQKQLEVKHAKAACYYTYPLDDELVKPTRLGNVLAAAEEYSYQVYRLDAVIWWPRLSALLPEAFRIQVDVALTPMLAVLNLSMIFFFSTLVEVILLLYQHEWLSGGLIFLVGLTLAWSCYLSSINQAEVYGRFVRVAFDLYRQEVLKQMHIPVPDNPVEERLLWDLLTEWHYLYRPPWEATNEKPELDNPFYYDTHNATLKTTKQQEVTVTFQGFSDLSSTKEMENNH